MFGKTPSEGIREFGGVPEEQLTDDRQRHQQTDEVLAIRRAGNYPAELAH